MVFASPLVPNNADAPARQNNWASGFIVGFCDQILSVLWYTTLQTKAAPAMIYRVSAYDHIGSVALFLLRLVAAGLRYEAYGYQITLTATIVLVVTPTKFFWLKGYAI